MPATSTLNDDAAIASASADGSATQEATPTTSVTRPPGKPAPRLNYKKSKNGCQRCRTRRVKCDEVYPTCGNCRRHAAICVYDRIIHRKPTRSVASSSGASSQLEESGFKPDSNVQLQWASNEINHLQEFQESRKRRLLELKILHHYMVKTAGTMPGTAAVLARGTFSRLIPDSAFRNDGLLYMLYSLSALHMAKNDPHDQQAMVAYQTYLDMGLQEHSKDIHRISKDNADAICLASAFIRIHAVAVLQDRPLDPYTSPMEWLETTNGAGKIFKEAWYFIKNDQSSIMWSQLRTPPMLDNYELLVAEKNRQGLLHLLERRSHEDPHEVWDEETRKAYEQSTSYIGGIQNALAAKERSADICRRCLVFPMVMSKRFISLTRELDPRALVILGHYFALLAKLRDSWWIGDTGRREIRGIQTALPVEWQDLMTWPLILAEEKVLEVRWADEMT